MEEQNIKKDLLGQVVVGRPHTGTLTSEDIDALTGSLAEGESIFFLCMGCSVIAPISSEGRDDLSERAGLSAVADWTGKYFQVSACPFCSKEGKFENPVLKDYRAS